MKKLILCVLVACANEDNLGNTIEGTADWSLALGGPGYESGTAVAVDSAGDVVVGGIGHLGTVDFGEGVMGNNNYWAFVAKRSASSGGPVWAVPITGLEASSLANVADIAIGSDDSIYVTGGYSGTVRFGGLELVASEGDMFVAKYTADGTLVWLRGLGPVSGAWGLSLVVDPADNVYVAGSFEGAFEFLGRGQSSLQVVTSFVVSCTSSGDPRWIVPLDPTVTISGLAASPVGDIATLGTFTAPTSLGGGQLETNSYSTRGFVARYHGDGTLVWSHALGSDRTGTMAVGTITIDSDDRTLIDGGTAVDPKTPGVTLLESFEAGGNESWRREDPFDRTEPIWGHVVRGATIVSAQWLDTPNGDSGYLHLTDLDQHGLTANIHIGERLVAGQLTTQVRDAAVGPNGELALVGDLGGEVVIGGAIATHGTDDTDALVVLIPPAR